MDRYQNKDAKSLREELHKIRGALTYLSLPELTQAMQACHEAVKAEPQDIEHLEKTVTAVMRVIENFQKAFSAESTHK
jgi:HPt (histidine-containing phosphotransfer) domain-containing protein